MWTESHGAHHCEISERFKAGDTLAVSILMEYNTNIYQTAWDAAEGASWRITLPINEEWW
jgi:hypothetical protein